MAITALATANTTIGPAQYADMAQALAPRFLVDGPLDLRPSISGNTLTLNPGAALAAGTRLRVSGTTSVTLPSATLVTRTYVVVVRVDWSKGATDAATLTYLPWSSSMVNSTSSPDVNKINRIPGVMYDAVICQVTRGTGIMDMVDLRLWGGDGGPLRVSQAGLDQPALIDARSGTMISTERGTFTKRLDSDGVWRDVGTPSNPWKMWTPTIRYHGMDPAQAANLGTTGGTVAQLGTNGQAIGRFRVVDGLLDGFISATTGAGANFGTGALTFDLPIPCASWQPDTWSEGHIWFAKTTTLGDRDLDFPAQVLIKAGWTRGQMFVPENGGSSSMLPHINSKKGAAGEGYPFILNGWSTGSVYTFHISYPVS